MEIILVIALTLIISGFALLANRIVGARLCPPCAGVFLTGVLSFVAYRAGYLANHLIPAILLGASVTGIAYWLDARLVPGKSPALWKMLFLPAGFAFVYGLLSESLAISAGSLAAAAILILYYARIPSQRDEGAADRRSIAEIKEKMKDCC